MENEKFISPQGQHSFSKFLKGFVYAFDGIKHAFKTQINFKFHSAAAILAVSAGIYFKISSSEWLWIIASIGFVLVAELLNTALEFLVDLVSPSYNIKAGMVKDLASAAVLIAALVALLIACFIFIPRLHFF